MPKHILITGASSGIGAELANLSACNGYTLSLCGKNPERLQQTVNACTENGAKVFAQDFCVSDLVAVKEFCQQAEQAFGPVEVLINCAGLNHARGHAATVAMDDIKWLMDINFYAPVAFIQALYPNMQTATAGTIVNVLSTVCLFANENISAYTASKAALDHYTKALRKESLEAGIKVISVYPGGVNSRFREAVRPGYLDAASVAQALWALLQMPVEVQPHELVLRPQCEKNF